MVKEKCLDDAKDALTLREQIMRLSVDILTPETRKGRYDVSGFNFVAGSIASELRREGFDVAAKRVEDAIGKYPRTIQESAVETSVDLTQAMVSLERVMFIKFCECEK